MDEQCPCGSGKVLSRCCGPYIEGDAQPPTAEALMRARYTAYDLGQSDYIIETHHPKGRKDLDREGTREWAMETDFHSLEILDTKDGGEDDDEGEVEFVVRYDEDGKLRTHHERSKFKKHKGKWYFTDGKVDVKGSEPIKRDQPKVGRNDPCPCGSGKKYKKCCLRTARA